MAFVVLVLVGNVSRNDQQHPDSENTILVHVSVMRRSTSTEGGNLGLVCRFPSFPFSYTGPPNTK